jgi:hypothetical protein
MPLNTSQAIRFAGLSKQGTLFNQFAEEPTYGSSLQLSTQSCKVSVGSTFKGRLYATVAQTQHCEQPVWEPPPETCMCRLELVHRGTAVPG